MSNTHTSFVNEDTVSSEVMPTSAQLAAARTVLGLQIRDLVRELRVGSQTVTRIETADGFRRANRSTVAAFVTFYEGQGVRFIEDGERVGLTWPRAAEPER